MFPSQAFPRLDEEPNDHTSLYISIGVVVCAAAAIGITWKRYHV